MRAARQSPDFGVRLLARLSPPARAELVRRWSLSEPAPEPVPAPLPGLRKCAPAPVPAGANGLGAQLQAFARSIGRVG